LPHRPSSSISVVCYIAESTEEFLDLILHQFGGRFMQLLAMPEHDAQVD